jgi:hypothetical protein
MINHTINLCPMCGGDLVATEPARVTERCSACDITFA